MAFDKLIREGRDADALRYLADEYYKNGKMGHTRKLLLERVADRCDNFAAQIAEAQADCKQKLIAETENYWLKQRLSEIEDLAISHHESGPYSEKDEVKFCLRVQELASEVDKEDFCQERAFAESLAKSLSVVKAELEQAQADNVALIDVLKSIHRYIHPHNSPQYSKFIDDLIDTVKDNLHPGDPTRKELEQLRAVRDAADMVLENWEAWSTCVAPDEMIILYRDRFIESIQVLAQAKAGEQHG